MKVLSVVGARPQFVKLAPVHTALVDAGHDHLIVHTGQHYDHGMSDVFFQDLGIPAPNQNLAVGSASHGRQTGQMLEGLEGSFLANSPDWVLVYGDTNSTLAAAVAAVKIHLPVAHLEAGLRSFNRSMPEEHNRVLTDHAADLLLAPTEVAMRHLADEGLAGRSVLVGDVMTDVCLRTRDRVLASPPQMPTGWRAGTPYVVATIHRQENTDDPTRLRQIVEHLAGSAVPVRLLVHPRLAAKSEEHSIPLGVGAIGIFEPLGYSQLVHAVLHSTGVVTDSGGLQKEAFLLDRPCITIRTETEWVETVESGWNVLDPDCRSDIAAALATTTNRRKPAPYGTGEAALLVVRALEEQST